MFMDLLKRFYWIPLCGVLLLGGYFWQTTRQRNNLIVAQSESAQQIATKASGVSAKAKTQKTNSTEAIVVDVKGAVKWPGIYHVRAEDRIFDVIQKAGGFNENADQTQVNLAQKVQDQAMIFIPAKGEMTQTPTNANSTASTPTSADPQTKINLNTATLEELQQIDGVGEKKAQKIVDYRTNQGPFKSIDDLDNVNGFGPKTVENFRDKVTI